MRQLLCIPLLFALLASSCRVRPTTYKVYVVRQPPTIVHREASPPAPRQFTIDAAKSESGYCLSDSLHAIARTFVLKVRQALHDNYPCKIASVAVDLTDRNGVLTLRYSAVLATCPAWEADWHFNRRGWMYGSKDKAFAIAQAADLALEQKTAAEPTLDGEFGWNQTIETHDVNAIRHCGKYYAVHDYFFIAKRRTTDR